MFGLDVDFMSDIHVGFVYCRNVDVFGRNVDVVFGRNVDDVFGRNVDVVCLLTVLFILCYDHTIDDVCGINDVRGHSADIFLAFMLMLSVALMFLDVLCSSDVSLMLFVG